MDRHHAEKVSIVYLVGCVREGERGEGEREKQGCGGERKGGHSSHLFQRWEERAGRLEALAELGSGKGLSLTGTGQIITES